ncbi:hypothetical protein JCM5350_002311 [Sporobolomyces pararoseus]
MSIQLGQCVVCGKECHTRCGACASKGLDWMFFCGQQHQKLICHTHKRVCGKENWEWPQLTKTEQKWVEEFAQCAAEPQEDRIAREINPRMNPAIGELTHLMSKLATGTSPVSQLFEKYFPETSNRNVQISRREAYHLRCVKDSPLGPPFDPEAVYKHLSTDPFGALGHFEYAKWSNLWRDPPTPYYRKVHHRLLIFFTLLGISYKDPTDPELRAFIQHAFIEAQDLVGQSHDLSSVAATDFNMTLATLAVDCLSSRDEN